MTLAKQAIIRCIREDGLKPGDRLPTQLEMRKRFGLGSVTIMTAFHELQMDRIIEIRDKVGVFVVDPDVDGHAGREVGLAINALGVSAFRSCLAHLIQIRLAERGWRVIPFFCMEPNLNGKVNLSAFSGLRRMIEQKEIQALVTLGDFSQSTLSFFRSQKLPVVYVGSRQTDMPQAGIDMPQFMRSAIMELRKQGCCCPGILISEALKPMLESEFIGMQGLPEFLFTGNFIADGVTVARKIQRLPELRRPDGLVIFDDMLASGFIAELHRLRMKTYPRLVILRNLQNPMDFAADDPIFFDVDLNVVAELSVEVLWQQLKGERQNVLKYMPVMHKGSSLSNTLSNTHYQPEESTIS